MHSLVSKNCIVLLFNRIADNANVNKMSGNNIVRIFGPTIMTVDTDESTFVNANYEFCVVETMFRQYHWMFQV